MCAPIVRAPQPRGRRGDAFQGHICGPVEVLRRPPPHASYSYLSRVGPPPMLPFPASLSKTARGVGGSEQCRHAASNGLETDCVGPLARRIGAEYEVGVFFFTRARYALLAEKEARRSVSTMQLCVFLSGRHRT